MPLQELSTVIGIAATVAGLGVGVFRYMLKSHEDVCAERYAGLQRGHAELTKIGDERHVENIDRINEVKASQIRSEGQLNAIAQTLAVMAAQRDRR